MQRGLDWRWRSYGAVAARVELLRGVLAEAVAGLAGGAGRGRPRDGAATRPPRVGFEDSGRPSALALDLAIQAAGACAAPLPAGLAGEALDRALTERGCALVARFEPRAGEVPPPPAAVPAVTLPRREPSEREAPPASARWAAGPVLTAAVEPSSGASAVERGAAAGGGGPAFAELSPARLLDAADRFAAGLAAARATAGLHRAPRRARRTAREILVLPRPLHDPAGRVLATWALAAGAALVLEPAPEHRVSAAAWVRPTVFAGDAEEIVALRAVLGERRRRGLPLGRLHTVVVLGGAGGEPALEDPDRGFWGDRGTAVTAGVTVV